MSLKVENVSYERQYNPIFENIHFQLNAGALLQIKGANGSGKTTLLRIVAGFLQPTAGNIRWHQYSILQTREAYQACLHFLGHQNGLKPQLTVLENMNLLSALSGAAISPIKIQSVLERLHLSAHRHQRVQQLSSGQQRRLSYARLLLLPKPLWILDEPMTGVDQAGQVFFTELLSTHVQQGGMALLTTHQPIAFTDAITTLQLGVTHA